MEERKVTRREKLVLMDAEFKWLFLRLMNRFVAIAVLLARCSTTNFGVMRADRSDLSRFVLLIALAGVVR